MLAAEARRWIVRLRSGEVTQAELDACAQWRDQSLGHRRAFAEATAQWSMLRQAARNVTATQSTAKSASAAPGRSLGRRAFLGGALAASVGAVAYLGARPPLGLWPSLSELAADIRTDVGERKTIALANNVSLEMNTRTSLVVAGAATQAREVELVAGEIAVNTVVAGNATSQPFTVIAAGGRVRAVSAAFDMRRDGRTVSVTCFEGDVQVECAGGSVGLKARQQIAYAEKGLGDIAATEGRAEEAWRRGLLVFENMPLSEVIPEINRYRRGRIVLMNADVGRLPLDATFRIDRIEDVVPKISALFGLKVRPLPGGVVLLG